MTGRAAAAGALYAAFLAAWALALAVRRRDTGPYLGLSIALLEAGLVVAALLGALDAAGGSEVAVHLGYLLASVLILPVGWSLSMTPERRDPLTLAVALAVLTVVILRVNATAA